MERDKSPKREVKRKSEFEGNWTFDWLQSYGMLALGLPGHVYFRIYDACILEIYKKTYSFHQMVHELILHTGWRKLCCYEDDNCYEPTYFEYEIDVFKKGEREIACGLDCQGKRDFWFQSDTRYYDTRGYSNFTKTKEGEKWSKKSPILERDFINEILKEILSLPSFHARFHHILATQKKPYKRATKDGNMESWINDNFKKNVAEKCYQIGDIEYDISMTRTNSTYYLFITKKSQGKNIGEFLSYWHPISGYDIDTDAVEEDEFYERLHAFLK